ncbi:MAG TPA: carboxypeptidase regulatory-like domain-containing protein [Polyangiaceae bacterium]|nr:carboxypeptidase regulatory-like domain-containing protein [Polyangiaceae bacterium]
MSSEALKQSAKGETMRANPAGHVATCAALLALASVAAPAFAVEPAVGAGDRARPALRRVAVPEPGTAGTWVAAADVGGGVTEALTDSDAAHARVAGRVAAAVDATPWLSFGAWLGGRYDVHPSDARGSDSGWLFQPELSSRLAWRAGKLGYGFEATAWLPGGADVGASLSGLSADARALLSHQSSRLLVAGYAGFRLDRSAEVAKGAERFRPGDRSALGVSEYDAVLGGAGVGYALGRTYLFGEVAAQLLLGSPKLSASPLWLSLGMRRPLGLPGLSYEVSVDALASARPEAGAELFPIEPRVTLNLGLRYRFGERAVEKAKPRPVAPKPLPVEVAVPAPKPASVELTLLDDRGQPLQRAQVAVTQGDVETPLVEVSPGQYRLEQARPGRARLRVKAEGFQPVERDVELQAGALRVDVRVDQALPAGQVRGLVRSLRGKPLAASIRVEPGGAQTSTDAEGFFQLDVPPGEYEVVIESPGYQPQRRKAKVDQQGVVIVNADLSQESGLLPAR